MPMADTRTISGLGMNFGNVPTPPPNPWEGVQHQLSLLCYDLGLSPVNNNFEDQLKKCREEIEKLKEARLFLRNCKYCGSDT